MRSSTFECVDQICVNIFLTTPLGMIDLVYTKPIYSTLENMCIITDLDESNTVFASIEELSKEERQDYLVAREKFKAQFHEGILEKSASPSHEVSRLRDALLHA